MANCNACGAWYSSTNTKELCHTCEQALKRLNGYAVPVVRCEQCRHYDDEGFCWRWDYEPGMSPNTVDPDDFCSYGERKDNEQT